MQLLPPSKQKVWGWPAVAYFVMVGTGTGFYLLSFLIANIEDRSLGAYQSVAYQLLAPMLIGLGFLSLAVEAGRPLRACHLFRRVRGSWMSLETLAGTIFILAAGTDWLFPHCIIRALAYIAAIVLMISQGFVIYRARAVTAWTVALMPVVFVTSGFGTGSGLLLLVAPDELTAGRALAIVALVCIVSNVAVWLLYLHWSSDSAFREATKVLRRPSAIILTVGMGHLLPALLLLLLLVKQGVDGEVEVFQMVATLAGLAMIAGGVSQKAGIILGASYTRGIALRR